MLKKFLLAGFGVKSLFLMHVLPRRKLAENTQSCKTASQHPKSLLENLSD